MTQATSDTVGETYIVVVRDGGKRVRVRLAIGLPYPDGDAFFSKVFIDGIEKPIAIGGADSLQALTQAVNFLRRQLLTFRDSADWELLMDDEENPTDKFPIEEFFGKR